MTAAPPPAGPEEPALVFQWERPARARWRLAAWAGGALAAHALTFYAFQVAYTPTGSQAPPPAQVLFIPLDRPDAPPPEREKIRSLTQWLDLNDPALAARPAPPRAAEEIAALGLRYVPSYAGAGPGFKPLEPPGSENPVPAPPRPRPPGPVPPGARAGTPAPTAPGPASAPTRVRLSEEIAALAPAPLPPVRWRAARGGKALEAAAFLVGVPAGGGMPFIFQQGESGDKAADAAARDYLAGLAFRPPEDGARVAWGWAEFLWGGDAYR